LPTFADVGVHCVDIGTPADISEEVATELYSSLTGNSEKLSSLLTSCMSKPDAIEANFNLTCTTHSDAEPTTPFIAKGYSRAVHQHHSRSGDAPGVLAVAFHG